MKELADKIRLIYVPFKLIAISFILIYTFLHWVLFIQLEMSLNEGVVKFWLPFGLPWIPILIWMRPRIKLLHYNNDKSSFCYQFLMCLVIAVATIIAQEYLSSATGKLTELDTVYQISEHKETKYYSFKIIILIKKEGLYIKQQQ